MKKILLLFSIVFLVSCMSEEERAAWEKERLDERKGEMQFKGSRKQTITLKYHDLDSCEYIGRLENGNADILAHSGHCKYCEKRHARLLDSLIKKNLYEFFAISKDSATVK